MARCITGINETYEKLTTGVKDTGGSFAAGVLIVNNDSNIRLSTQYCKLNKKKKVNLAVRHVTGNDKDYLRKIPRVVW